MSALATVTTTLFTLERTPLGALVLTNAAGERFEGVVPVRAFPVQAPDDGISMVSTEGKEVAWIDALTEVAEPAQGLIRNALEGREFMPVVARIVAVSSYATPCTWTVDTDRGTTDFVLRGDEDIRRIGKEHALLIADVHGIQYLVRDQFALDAHSRRILDRFM